MSSYISIILLITQLISIKFTGEMFQPCHFLHASSVCEVVDGTNYSVKNGSYAVTAWDVLSSPFRKKLTKRSVENNTGENIIFTPSKNLANANESIEYSPYTFREKQFTRRRRNLHVRIHVHFNNQNDVQESEEVVPSHEARHKQHRPQRIKTIRRKPPKGHRKPTKHKVIKQHNEEEEPPELNNGYDDANDGRIEPQDYGDEQNVPDEDTNPDDHEYRGDNENTDEGVSNIGDGKNEGPSNSTGKEAKKMPTDAKEILKMLFRASLKGTKNKDCQWCVVQFLEKAALGPFAPLGMLVSPKVLKRAKFMVSGLKSLGVDPSSVANAAKKLAPKLGNSIGNTVKGAEKVSGSVGKTAGEAANGVKNAGGKLLKHLHIGR